MAMRIPHHFSACTAVSRELPTPLPIPRDDHLEAAVEQGSVREEALAVDHQTGVGVARNLFGPVAEADPGRRHGVGVDVVEQVIHRQLRHRQVELSGQLAADQLGILGQEQDPLARSQAHGLGWSLLGRRRHGRHIL